MMELSPKETEVTVMLIRQFLKQEKAWVREGSEDAQAMKRALAVLSSNLIEMKTYNKGVRNETR
jgi:hypothetical protein